MPQLSCTQLYLSETPLAQTHCGSLKDIETVGCETNCFLAFYFLFLVPNIFIPKRSQFPKKRSNGLGLSTLENGARVYGEERARHLLGLPVFFDLYLRTHDIHKGVTKSIRTHAFVSLSFLPLAFLLLSFHHLRASQSPLVLHVPLSFLGCFPIISLLSRGDLLPFPL